MQKIVIGVFLICLVFPGTGHAAAPLVTDDTGTQGKGKFQIELSQIPPAKPEACKTVDRSKRL